MAIASIESVSSFFIILNFPTKVAFYFDNAKHHLQKNVTFVTFVENVKNHFYGGVQKQLNKKEGKLYKNYKNYNFYIKGVIDIIYIYARVQEAVLTFSTFSTFSTNWLTSSV